MAPEPTKKLTSRQTQRDQKYTTFKDQTGDLKTLIMWTISRVKYIYIYKIKFKKIKNEEDDINKIELKDSVILRKT